MGGSKGGCEGGVGIDGCELLSVCWCVCRVEVVMYVGVEMGVGMGCCGVHGWSGRRGWDSGEYCWVRRKAQIKCKILESPVLALCRSDLRPDASEWSGLTCLQPYPSEKVVRPFILTAIASVIMLWNLISICTYLALFWFYLFYLFYFDFNYFTTY